MKTETANGDISLAEWKQFLDNRAKYPTEQLLQYAGQHIAWKLDGTGVAATAPDIPALETRLRELGYDPSRVVWSYVDPLDAR